MLLIKTATFYKRPIYKIGFTYFIQFGENFKLIIQINVNLKYKEINVEE